MTLKVWGYSLALYLWNYPKAKGRTRSAGRGFKLAEIRATDRNDRNRDQHKNLNGNLKARAL